MGGKHYNEGVLTPAFLTLAVEEGKSTQDIERETGISRRTVFNYMGKHGIACGQETPDEIRLKALIDQAHAKADELQVLYFKIDKLKARVVDNDRVDMAKITALAQKVRQR